MFDFDTMNEKLKVLVLRPNSQANEIANELLHSIRKHLNEHPMDEVNADDYYSSVNDILVNLRRAVIWSGENYKIYGKDLEEFREYLNAIDDKNERQKVARNYDEFWSHRNSAAQFGRKDIDKSKTTGELNNETLDEVAAAYMRYPILSSKLLEWILIDALLYGEVVAFARKIHYMPPNMMRHAFQRLFQELTGLAWSYAIAVLVDSSYGVGFWTIMGAISLARWLKPDAANQRATKDIKLLMEMATIQAELEAWHYNPNFLRQRLYHVSNKGAVFSRYVYNLLDRRIVREQLNWL